MFSYIFKITGLAELIKKAKSETSSEPKEETVDGAAFNSDPFQEAMKKTKARLNLAMHGCLGRKRPPVLNIVLLVALLGVCIYIEAHLLAVLCGLLLVIALLSYVTIQKWIDIVGNDVHASPTDAESDAGSKEGPIPQAS